MSLRNRLGLLVAGLTLLVTVGFGLLSYRNFVHQQDAGLHALLEQDLLRVSTLMESPTLGASLVDSEASDFILQFVGPSGQVLFSSGERQPLPAMVQPQQMTLDGSRYLVGQTDWRGTGGTIRVAHDIESALLARAQLRRNLLASGLIITLAAALLGLLITRWMLHPVHEVSRQARSLRPDTPGALDYRGPQDEIADLTTALNGALALIRQRQEEERSFLLEIAHELAAPLTLVRFHLLEASKEHPGDERLHTAAQSAQELLRTSQDLLVLARGELERPLDLQLFPIADVLARVASEYPGVNVRADASGEVIADPERLAQVVRNLVRNAVQAGGAPEAVSVVHYQDGPNQVLQVSDVGPGIPEEELELVWARGFSGRRGVGVGLNVARTLIEQHGGSITVESKLGEGSIFTVTLPGLDTEPPPGPASDQEPGQGARQPDSQAPDPAPEQGARQPASQAPDPAPERGARQPDSQAPDPAPGQEPGTETAAVLPSRRR